MEAVNDVHVSEPGLVVIGIAASDDEPTDHSDSP